KVYRTLPGSFSLNHNKDMCLTLVSHLLTQDYGIKRFAELYLHTERKIPFARFYPEIRDDLEEFLTRSFIVYFEESFNSLFRIIKSLDMKQYACAFII